MNFRMWIQSELNMKNFDQLECYGTWFGTGIVNLLPHAVRIVHWIIIGLIFVIYFNLRYLLLSSWTRLLL